MTLKEQVTQVIEDLTERELQRVVEYLEFLKFQTRLRAAPVFDERTAALYTEFAEEDRQLAEEGMTDYSEGLLAEDEH